MVNAQSNENGTRNMQLLLHKWGMAESSLCECGKLQTIKHIDETCPSTMFEEGLAELQEGGPAALKWLEELVITSVISVIISINVIIIIITTITFLPNSLCFRVWCFDLASPLFPQCAAN